MTMGKMVIKYFTRYCSYTNCVRCASYISSCCKCPIVYIGAKNYENRLAVDTVIEVIKGCHFMGHRVYCWFLIPC